MPKRITFCSALSEIKKGRMSNREERKRERKREGSEFLKVNERNDKRPFFGSIKR